MNSAWHNTRLGKIFKSRRTRGQAGLPTLSVTMNGGLVARDSLDRKTDTNLLPEEHLFVKKNDIAYNMMRMWQGALGLAHHDAIVSPAYIVLQSSKEIDPLFAEYLFKTPRFIHLFWAYSYGLTNDRLRLYFKDFGLIPCDIPPLAEQKRIAEILSTWDRAIETTEKLIANSEAQKKALRQQLLTGKKRLPGFSGEWRTTKIGKLCNVTTGQPAPNENSAFGESGLPFVRVSSLSKLKNTSVSEFELVSERAAKKWGLQKFEPGTLIFAKSGMSAKLGKIELLDRSVYLVSHLAALTAKNTNDIRFIKYWFEMNSPGQLVQGDGFPSIRTSEIKLLSIRIPDTQEQKAVADAIAVADRAERNLVEMKSRLASEKFALMQQLLTGKRRVKVKREAHAA